MAYLRARTPVVESVEAVDTFGLMASANLELVRSIVADWERGDFSSTEWAHPEIEYVIDDGLSRSRWTGVAAMNDAWRNFASAWEEWRVELEDCRELGGERVLLLIHYSARGKRSGLEIGQMRSKGLCCSTSATAR